MKEIKNPSEKLVKEVLNGSLLDFLVPDRNDKVLSKEVRKANGKVYMITISMKNQVVELLELDLKV